MIILPADKNPGRKARRVCFEQLEAWVGEKIQQWVQELLEEEVTELLGRRTSQRRKAGDPLPATETATAKAGA